MFGNFNNSLIKCPSCVIRICEDVSPFNIKSTSYDVFCIFTGKPFAFNISQVALPQETCIVTELYHYRHLESILQILCEHEGDEMAKLQPFV